MKKIALILLVAVLTACSNDGKPEGAGHSFYGCATPLPGYEGRFKMERIAEDGSGDVTAYLVTFDKDSSIFIWKRGNWAGTPLIK